MESRKLPSFLLCKEVPSPPTLKNLSIASIANSVVLCEKVYYDIYDYFWYNITNNNKIEAVILDHNITYIPRRGIDTFDYINTVKSLNLEEIIKLRKNPLWHYNFKTGNSTVFISEIEFCFAENPISIIPKSEEDYKNRKVLKARRKLNFD